MTTITALNVRLGMDVSNFSEGANLAKSEVTKVATIMRQSVPPAEKYKQELDLLNRAFSEAGKKSREYGNAVEHLKRKHEQVAPAIRDTARATKESQSSSASAISSIKGMAAAYIGFQTVAKSLQLATQVEDATIAFEVLTGSVEEGRQLFEQIRQFAAESPVTFSNASEATKTMLSFGVAAQDVQKNLQMLSDVTGGNNERFKMLSLAFSQTTAAGRLMGQDLLQMVNAGFNPLQQISKDTGETLLELKARMEAGGISADEVRTAFENATAEGGMFYGMTERLSETLSGKMNIALSDMEQKLAAAGQALAPLGLMLFEAFDLVKPVLDDIVSVIQRVVDGLSLMVAFVRDVFNTATTGVNDITQIDKLLDRIEQRERDAEDAKARASDKNLQKREAAAKQVAAAEQKAAQEAAAAQRKTLEEHKKQQEQAAKDEKKRIEDQEKARLKAIENEKKERERAEKQAEEQFQRDLENARKAAMDYFTQQEQKQQQRRADVAAGPGAGMEVGSAEAAKFAADRVNSQIGVAAVPDQPTPGETEIAKKAEQLYKEQQRAVKVAETQTTILTQLVTATKENGFKRIR
jgi:tape measure domain-containing protein